MFGFLLNLLEPNFAFMKKRHLTFSVVFSLLIFQNVNSQVNFGITFGTPTLIGAELGYSITDKIHVGVVAWPKLGLIDEPGFYGGFFRKTFAEQPLFELGYYSLAFRPLVFGMVGMVSSIETEYFDSNFDYRTRNIPAQLGGCVGGGGELVWGNGRMVYPFEIGFGKMPSTFTAISNISSDNPKSTSALYLNFGIRFYLGYRD
jgi:hypothetical protein